jgi:hypothetical protein
MQYCLQIERRFIITTQSVDVTFRVEPEWISSSVLENNTRRNTSDERSKQERFHIGVLENFENQRHFIFTLSFSYQNDDLLWTNRLDQCCCIVNGCPLGFDEFDGHGNQ